MANNFQESLVNSNMRNVYSIERKSTLTPVSGCISPALLCFEIVLEIVDRRLNDLIALGEDTRSISCSFDPILSATTTAIPSTRLSITTSPTTIAAPSLPSSNRADGKRKRLYHHRQEVPNSIASRLPARSQATIHRRFSTAIARHLPPRIANPATYNRSSKWINRNPNTGYRT